MMQQQEALGHSRGGFSIKIHIQAEGRGKPIQFALTQGQISDVKGFDKLNASVKVKCQGRGRSKQRSRVISLGTRRTTVTRIRRVLCRQRTTLIIPKRKNVLYKPYFNRGLYRERNRIESLINRIKQFRRLATRYEKRVDNYLAMLTIEAILIWLK